MTDREYIIHATEQIGKLQQMSTKRKIWIYGIGHGADLLFAIIESSGVGIKGFIDKKVGLVDEYKGLPVCSMSTLNPSDDFILVSLMKYNSEIEECIKKCGFCDSDCMFVVGNKENLSIIRNRDDILCALGSVDKMSNIKDINAMMLHNSESHLFDLFWKFRDEALFSKTELDKKRASLKCQLLLEHFGASIPISKEVNRFYCPHGLKGIFISSAAKIGKGCTILQNVTIGSNTLIDSNGIGFPVISEDVYIGAGAVIIGNIRVGRNARIGANCTVTKDVPECAVAITKETSIIQKYNNNNKFLSANKVLKEYPITESAASDPMENYPKRVMSCEQIKGFEEAFRITFCGDLILLEDQVKLGYKDGRYDYDSVFEYVRSYINSADLAIGVFEGPMGGEEKGFSTSNFADGKVIKLNYPDEFGKAVHDAGFNLVTTANNHVLDAGIDGATRTIGVLDEIGLEHIGSYRSQEEKQNDRVKILEKQGFRFAFLAYTFGINGYNTESFLTSNYSYVTSIITGMEGDLFERQYSEVKSDFEKAKSFNPDFIVVLPHMGTEFVNYPDEFQKKWVRIFAECGADIILGCHTHTVQPISFLSEEGRNVFVSYGPGNLSNIYRDKQGDTSMLVDIYISKNEREIIGGGIVPLYTMANCDGNYKAIPINQLNSNVEIRKRVSTDDLVRIKKAHSIITQVALGYQLDLSSVHDRYYLDKCGYIREKTTRNFTVEVNLALKTFFSIPNVCFVGDSITAGNKNGGVPWFEPLEEYMIEQHISTFSKGASTCNFFVMHANSIPQADLFVIAVGTNDVRYRDATVCAMTPKEYVEKLDILRYTLKKKNPGTRFIFITPWYSTDGDPYTVLSYKEKMMLNQKYYDALREWCLVNQDIFVEPNAYIKSVLEKYPQSDYLIDHIHPNANKGVNLYSKAFLLELRKTMID